MMMKIILFVSFLCLGLNAEEEKCVFKSRDEYLPNLVKKSRESQACLREARRIFKQIPYIKLEGPFENETKINVAQAIFNQIPMHMSNFTDILYALETFGDCTIYIDADFREISAADGKEIVKRINSHCPAVVHLKLEYCHGNILDDLNGELPSVSSLHFSSHFTQELSIKPDNKKCHEVFPNLMHLKLGNVKTPDEWAYLTETYKRLGFIEIHTALFGDDQEQFVELVKQNPQTIGVTIHSATRELLSNIHGVLPSLKFVYIYGLAPDYSNFDEIKLKGVRQFSFVSKSKDEIPDGINLVDVEELSLEIPFSFNKKWMDFLKNQVNHFDSNLYKLRVKVKNLKKVQLIKIVEALPYLKQLNIEVESRFEINDILEMLKKFEENNLERFTLEYAGLVEAHAIELEQQLDEWDAIFESKDGKSQIVFEKL